MAKSPFLEGTSTQLLQGFQGSLATGPQRTASVRYGFVPSLLYILLDPFGGDTKIEAPNKHAFNMLCTTQYLLMRISLHVWIYTYNIHCIPHKHGYNPVFTNICFLRALRLRQGTATSQRRSESLRDNLNKKAHKRVKLIWSWRNFEKLQTCQFTKIFKSQNTNKQQVFVLLNRTSPYWPRCVFDGWYSCLNYFQAVKCQAWSHLTRRHPG